MYVNPTKQPNAMSTTRISSSSRGDDIKRVVFVFPIYGGNNQAIVPCLYILPEKRFLVMCHKINGLAEVQQFLEL